MDQNQFDVDCERVQIMIDRKAFAMAAMQGILASAFSRYAMDCTIPEAYREDLIARRAARRAVSQADALLLALHTTPLPQFNTQKKEGE